MKLPSRDANEWEWLLFEQHGVLTWAQATRMLSPGAVRHRVKRGRWRAVCRGVLLTDAQPPSFEQHCWIAVLAAGPGAMIAALAAARLGGLRGKWADSRIDVLVPGDRHRAALLKRLPFDLPAVRVRRSHTLVEEDRQAGHPVRTAMPRSVVEAAAWSRFDDEAQRIVASACQQRLVTPEELVAVVARLPRVRRRALIVATARDLAGGATALSEIDLVRLCRKHQLPLPDMQEKRVDAAGRVRYLDGRWRKYQVVAEVDGGHHMEVRHWDADMKRQNDIWTKGERILRFTANQVRNQPEYVVRTLRRAFGLEI